jgi:crossover junction endodeoxyribonuclease RusA
MHDMIVLPWPDKGLSPNARLHWSKLAANKKQARHDAHILATMALSLKQRRDIAAREGRIDIVIRFYPPDARLRDDDNMVASFKAARDGIADALGVDDRRFRPIYQFMDPEKPGRIEVYLYDPRNQTLSSTPRLGAITQAGPSV